MTSIPSSVSRARSRCLVGALLALTGSAALGQDAPVQIQAAAPGAADPSPYYIGATQAFTHDSNVYRVPFGPSDNFSSTSVLAGFGQPISRQRVFGTATVALNRYQDQTQLDNTSYGLLLGLDLATIWKLSGSVNASLDQRLAAPAASADTPVQTRNLEMRKGVAATGRWGGDSTLSMEARGGYSTVDYSAEEYAASDSKFEYGSIGAYYRPGSFVRTGVALRFDRTRSPRAVRLADGSDQGNDTRGKNLDLIVEYNNGASLEGSTRLSYTRQTNSSVEGADFSGLTGSLLLGWRPTAKVALQLAASREAGFNATSRAGYSAAVVTTPSTTLVTLLPSNTLYENNQVTNAVSAGVAYAATSKISLTSNARYTRARIVTSSSVAASSSQSAVAITDVSKGIALGANYAYSRFWTFACGLSRERREVDGARSYGYTVDTANCSAQLLWR